MRRNLLLVGILGISPLLSLAQTEPAPLCSQAMPAPIDTSSVSIQSELTPDPKLPKDSIEAYADNLEMLNQSELSLSGNVVLTSAKQRVRAEQANINQASGKIELLGNINVQSDALELTSDSGYFNQRKQQSKFSNAQYRMLETRGNGSAGAMRVLSPQVTQLDDAAYTTCDLPNPDWQIRASQLTLDQNKGFGTAKHLRLSLGNVPVFYWPYLTFPIDDRRKSGLLFPQIGQSDSNGLEYAQPIYWDIHPQFDTTITPRYLSKRGTQMQNQWRHLNHWGKYQLDGEYLDDEQTKTERWLGAFTHTGGNQHWSTQLNVRQVSDGEYLNDLGSNLSVGRPQHLHSYGSVNYQGSIWQHRIGADAYQTLDQTLSRADSPYERKPYFNSRALWSPSNGSHTQWEWRSQITTFKHIEKTQGNRLDVQPSVSHRFGSLSAYLTPELTVRYTQYDLDETRLTIAQDPQLSRSTPIASIDSGVAFDRYGEHYQQSLEPRLYLLYVPVVKQDELPLFDTGVYDFSYEALFINNRFTGADRQGDAQQASVGLTHRLQSNDSQRDILVTRIGQAFYGKDREVSLNATTASTSINARRHSDIALDTTWHITERLKTKAQWQYNPDTEETQQQHYQIAYQDTAKRLVSLAYREQLNQYKQSEVLTSLPLGKRWQWVGRWLYDVENNQSLETFSGARYQSCCWAVSLYGRRRLNNDEYNNEIYLQFTLNGLGNVGADTQTLLNRTLYGYEE